MAVDARRRELGLPNDQAAFLIMDNCSAHTDRQVEEVLGQHHIVPVLIPPHTSHIFQPLDRVCFSSFKAHLRTAIPDQDVDKQTAHLLKILRSWEDAMKTDPIMGSFKRCGFVTHNRERSLFVTFNPDTVDEVNGVVHPRLNEQPSDQPAAEQPAAQQPRPRRPRGRRIHL